jgi:ABC-type antimicrobial peptide transport system permease subunit
MTIVGVASDLKGRSLAEPDPASVYAPFLQRRIEWNRWGTVVVRGEEDPASLVPALRAAVRAADPDVPLQDVQTLSARVKRAAAPQRFNARVVSLFGALSVALALQGLYGLLSFVVERSRREISVRLSVGARAADVVRLVAGRGLRHVALGLIAGLPAAYALARAASTVLFGVTPADPATYAVASLGLVVAAALACFVPALRAARLDPVVALREP